MNPRTSFEQPFEILNDGAHGFRLGLYYVRPDHQIQQLEEAGFGVDVIYDGNGKSVFVEDEPAGSLSFLCDRTGNRVERPPTSAGQPDLETAPVRLMGNS